MSKLNSGKKNSILNFTAIVLLTLVGLFLTVANFVVPFTSQRYNGFINSISLGLDLSGGVSAVYECNLSADSNTDNLDEAIDATVSRLTSMITEDYNEATVVRQGDTRIRIEVPSVNDPQEVFNLIGQPTPLYMTLSGDASTAKRYITGSDISSVNVDYQKNDDGEYVYGVAVKFTDEGTTAFANLTGDAANGDQTIYIYLGDPEDSETEKLTLTCESKIVGGSTFISGGSLDSQEEAEAYALKIMSGTFNVSLKLLESSVISATLGDQALKYALIGGIIGLILIVLILWWRYGDFGWLASFALIIYTILMIFFLQAIPGVQLTLPGLAGIILSIGMAVDGTVIIYERIREEYKAGKRIPLSAKIGFKKAFWPIFDSNITTVFTTIVLYILGTASIQGFAITLLIGILLSMFMNLVLIRGFVKWYLPFNSVNAKKLHLPKQVRPERTATEVVVGGQGNE